MTFSNRSVAFVPALAIPVRARSTFICGGVAPGTARVRSVRRAHVAWRACAEKANEPTAAAEPESPVSVPEAEPAVSVPETEPAVSESVPEAESVAEAAASPVASAEATAEASEGATPDGEQKTNSENGERRDRRNRRRRKRREVTLPLEKMEIGMELEGIVKSVTSYGAFIGDMGTPTDGLLHVSQLSSQYVENVTDIVQVGQKVKVRVTDINLEKSNFSLSMKPLSNNNVSEDGNIGNRNGTEFGSRNSSTSELRQSRREQTRAKWEAFKYDENVFLDAQVVSIADFGCFCKLLDSQGNPDTTVPTEGLVHISEVSTERVEKMSDAVEVNQIIKVRIVGIDKKRSRISLSMKDKSASRDFNGGNDRGNDRGKNSSLSEEIRKSNENQPTFKTSFELAFERAGLKTEKLEV